MFETLFKHPAVLTRHREGPAAEERQRFLIHRASEGVARNTLLGNAKDLLIIAKNIDITSGKAISRHDLEIAAAKWAHYQRRKRHSHGPRRSRELFLRLGTSWLRFLSRLQEAQPAPSPYADLIQDFVLYMRAERGLSEVTIRGRCWHVEKLLAWLMSQNRFLAAVSITDIDTFLSEKGGQDWGRVSVATSAKALRSFFRHAEMQGWCAGGIAAAISGPRLFKQESLPVGPGWGDVQRLFSNSNDDQPREIRDRAILMLFAIYGFRSAEVAGLRLEDVNWTRDHCDHASQTASSPGISSATECGQSHHSVSPTSPATLFAAGDLSNFEGPTSAALAGGLVLLGQQSFSYAAHREPASRSSFSPPCLCRTSCSRGILA